MAALQVESPSWMDGDLKIFEGEARKFLERECVPHAEKWIKQQHVDRAAWKKAGEAGLLCASTPEEFGGAGGTFAHEAVIIDLLGKMGIDGWGLVLHNAIVAPYVTHYGTDEQRKRWLPRLASGDLVAAIAMTEPGTGSDLQSVKTTAKLDGNQYVINGSKTFITNGGTANFVVVVAKTDPTQGSKGTSLIVVETDEVQGFRRGRVLDKIGQKANDTAELFFDEVRVPASNLIGPGPGQGFVQLMQQLPQERLIIALQAMAVIERALETTVSYVKERKAFGKQLIEFQNTQFKLAECKTEATVGKVFCNHLMDLHLNKKLDPFMASMAKLWLTDVQCRVVDECLQLHGGYGYMNEYPIARMYADSRVQKIYGGTNEIMKLLIARSL
ncbi:MAG: acyl-CoA dehydrogenase [Alphaproteobacteria bacterium]|nr:acyl-CoA dehydrogenase [Alphaproteobacteria bacterium]